jgi:hypothetical protein
MDLLVNDGFERSIVPTHVGLFAFDDKGGVLASPLFETLVGSEAADSPAACFTGLVRRRAHGVTLRL